jgi:hypothetical protein
LLFCRDLDEVGIGIDDRGIVGVEGAVATVVQIDIAGDSCSVGSNPRTRGLVKVGVEVEYLVGTDD